MTMTMTIIIKLITIMIITVVNMYRLDVQICAGVSPQHRQPSAMWIWSEVFKCEGVCVDGSNRLHSDDQWLLEPSL